MAKGDINVRVNDELKDLFTKWGKKRNLSVNQAIVVLASEKLLESMGPVIINDDVLGGGNCFGGVTPLSHDNSLTNGGYVGVTGGSGTGKSTYNKES